MKKITLSLFSIALLAFTGSMTAQQAENVLDYNQNPVPGNTEIINPGTNYQVAGGVIYSNGPIFNVAGGGAGGADLSLLETSLGMSTLGAGMQSTAGNRIADDWVVTDAVEVISIDFYGYQTNSPTTSTMTGMTLRIWDGDPSDPASTVIYGDDFTNVLTNSTWSGVYRASEGSETSTARPIMVNTVDTPGLALAPGTYWLDWDAAGSLASGPWQPPVVILGQSTTGNAKQFVSGAWQNLEDGGSFTQLGAPFDVTGTVLSIADNVLEGFTFYPNPTSEMLNVSAKANIDNISIYNVLGQEVINVSPNTSTAKVDLGSLSNGMYIMKATVAGNVGSFNVVKK